MSGSMAAIWIGGYYDAGFEELLPRDAGEAECVC